MARSTRRAFLRQVSAAGAVLASWSMARAEENPARAGRPIRLGAPVFHAPEDPDALARAHRALGYRAAYCPGVSLDDRDRVRALREAFARADVVIAEVGRWVNLLDANPQTRAENLARVTEGLALAEEIGARCCVDIAGSFSEQSWFGPHPKNVTRAFFDAAVENARKIIDAVQPRTARFCYEMMGWALPDGADAYLELIRAVDRPAFGAHLDPCNLVNSPDRFYHNGRLLDECFDKLGPWIVSCHAKDLTWDVEMNIHFREVPLGEGSLDYGVFLKRLAALPNDVPLMIEHMAGEAEYDTSRRHLFDLAPKLGVQFE